MQQSEAPEGQARISEWRVFGEEDIHGHGEFPEAMSPWGKHSRRGWCPLPIQGLAGLGESTWPPEPRKWGL